MTKVRVDPVIRQLTDRIVERFHPEGVILFGSHARGTAHAYSDVDLLVVLPSCPDLRKATFDMEDAVRDLGVRTEVVVTTPELLHRRGDLIGNVFRPALREGIVLYGSPKLKKRYKVSEAEVLEETRSWLRQAKEDLGTAELALAHEPPYINSASFLSQQAVEKAFKAVLIWLQIEFPYVHELVPLRDLIPDGWEVKSEPADLKQLSQWVTAGRYPKAPWPPPGVPEAREAVDTARRMVTAVTRDLAARGFTLEEQ